MGYNHSYSHHLPLSPSLLMLTVLASNHKRWGVVSYVCDNKQSPTLLSRRESILRCKKCEPWGYVCTVNEAVANWRQLPPTANVFSPEKRDLSVVVQRWHCSCMLQ